PPTIITWKSASWKTRALPTGGLSRSRCASIQPLRLKAVSCAKGAPSPECPAREGASRFVITIPAVDQRRGGGGRLPGGRGARPDLPDRRGVFHPPGGGGPDPVAARRADLGGVLLHRDRPAVDRSVLALPGRHRRRAAARGVRRRRGAPRPALDRDLRGAL